MIQGNLNVVSITPYPHNAEPWCLCAAHEVAALISGSRWRASKWEAQSGSMYVISKRMTLAGSQLRFGHTKHTLFCPRLSLFLYVPPSSQLPLSLTHTLLHIPVCGFAAGDNIHSSTLSLHQKEKPFVRHSERLFAMPLHAGDYILSHLQHLPLRVEVFAARLRRCLMVNTWCSVGKHSYPCLPKQVWAPFLSFFIMPQQKPAAPKSTRLWVFDSCNITPKRH